MSSLVRLCLVGGLVVWGSCTDPNPRWDRGTTADPATEDPTPTIDGRQTEPTARDAAPPDAQEVPGPAGVDVLLVVDNSPGMRPAQERLSDSVETLLAALDRLPGDPDYRVAVVSTDLGVGIYANEACSEGGDGAALQTGDDCDAGGVPYVEVTGGRSNVASPKETLQCRVEVGTEGCGFEQPLEAMRRALQRGFIRPAAALAVLILSNEDDCSAADPSLYDALAYDMGPYSSYRCFRYGVLCDGEQPPLSLAELEGCVPGQAWLHAVDARYARFLGQLKPTGWVSLQVIAGPVPAEVKIVPGLGAPVYWKVKPSCTDEDFDADPAIRLSTLVDALGSQAGRASICQASYREPIEAWVERLLPAFE